MDARIMPGAVLGLKEGVCCVFSPLVVAAQHPPLTPPQDMHVIRNAGGRASEAVRSICISQQLLGTTEVYLIHHTDCGMLCFKDSDIAGIIKTNLGVDVGDRKFLPFSDVDESVREDVALLEAEPLVKPGTSIIGLTYDVASGKLREVAKATKA